MYPKYWRVRNCLICHVPGYLLVYFKKVAGFTNERTLKKSENSYDDLCIKLCHYAMII